MKARLKATGRDAFDRLYARVMDRVDLPPYTLRCHVGPAWEYERIPSEYVAYFKLLAGLGPNERVLDIGCGTGRFAAELVGQPHFFRGVYRGFDIDRRALGWAQAHVRSDRADIGFDLLDLHNTHYNPTGRMAPEGARFPYDDGSFDFAFAMSVFTHLLAKTAVRYLQELHRVLRPGGRAVVSFVLLDEVPERLGQPAFDRLYGGVLVANGLAQGDTNAGRLYEMGDGVWTLTPSDPELVTLYDMDALRAWVAEAELEIAEVRRGSWSLEGGGPAFQDLVVLRRP